jgi:hypothetical protein
LKVLRQLLRRTPFYGVYKAAGHYPDYLYWKLRGEPLHPPHLVKQQTVREYSELFGLHVLVETGTYYGEMVAAMKNRFAQIYSIELNPELALRARQKFSRFPHIHILQGDSQQILPKILQSLAQAALFWLDAGYYGWAGVQGDKLRLTTELEAILSSKIKEHVILMDDAHGLNGQNGAPTVEQLKESIETRFPVHSLQVKHNILRITPTRSK